MTCPGHLSAFILSSSLLQPCELISVLPILEHSLAQSLSICCSLHLDHLPLWSVWFVSSIHSLYTIAISEMSLESYSSEANHLYTCFLYTSRFTSSSVLSLLYDLFSACLPISSFSHPHQLVPGGQSSALHSLIFLHLLTYSRLNKYKNVFTGQS